MVSTPGTIRPRQPVIILDTTALFADPRLRKELSPLLDLAENELIRLIIPEVVILEAERQQTERAIKANNEAIKKATEGLRELRELIADVPDLDSKMLRERLSQIPNHYGAWLRDQFEDHAVEIADIPEVSHESLLGWDLGGRKPFQRSGKGYRDALIWSSVVETAKALEKNDRLIFVSNNTVDFTDGKDLDSALLADLKESLAAFSHVRTPAQAIESISDTLDALRAEYDNPGQWLTTKLIVSTVQESLESTMQRLTGAEMNVSIPTDPLEGATWYNVDFDFSEVKWNLRESSSYEIFGEISVAADVTIDGYVSKSHYYATEEELDIDVFDEDWNDQSIWAAAYRRVELVFDITLDGEGKEAIDVALIDAR